MAMNQQIWEFFASRCQIEGKPVKLSNGFERSVYQDIEALIANTNYKLIPFDEKNREFCKGNDTLSSVDFLLLNAVQNESCKEFLFIELKDFSNMNQSLITPENVDNAIEAFTQLIQLGNSNENIVPKNELQALKKITHSALVVMALLQDSGIPIKDVLLSKGEILFSFFFVVNIDDFDALRIFFSSTTDLVEDFRNFVVKIFPFIDNLNLEFMTKNELIEKLQNQIPSA
jgi:hypothetical protein